MNGLIYNIQRFAVHDGPGIRTLVYMKGCPLRCLWCSSPQSQRAVPELLYNRLRCQKCGRCAESCPVEAIAFFGQAGPKIDRELCSGCGHCVDSCPAHALELTGNSLTVEQLFRLIDRDSLFYRRSGGGVTVGGGEPTVQHEFVGEFLLRCRRRYIHTAMETCAHAQWVYLKRLVDQLDLVFIDIKHMDSSRHLELTGVPNEGILENLRQTVSLRPVIIRIPLVPGFNDSEENIRATAAFAARLGENVHRIEFLPYHDYGSQTYDRLDRKYQLNEVQPPSNDQLQRLIAIAEVVGIKARIGG